jgi:hypothetical protein
MATASEGAGAPAARRRVIALFDVDGTLTASRQPATPAVLSFLAALRGRVHTGMVGGSDLAKQREQLGPGVTTMLPMVGVLSVTISTSCEIEANPSLPLTVTVRFDAVRLDEGVFPPGAEVPHGAHRGDGDVGPAVAGAERGEIDVRDPVSVIVQQSVRQAGVAVADEELAAGICLSAYEEAMDAQAAMFAIQEASWADMRIKALADQVTRALSEYSVALWQQRYALCAVRDHQALKNWAAALDGHWPLPWWLQEVRCPNP